MSTDITATISGTVLTATVPYGTDLTALVATFTTTGVSLSVAGTVQTSGTTANDFSGSVVYTVTAADGSTAEYTVTVNQALNSAKEITAFSLTSSSNSSLKQDITATVSENNRTITAVLPFSLSEAVLTNLVPTFSTTGVSVSVGDTVQTSGVTSNDFSHTVTYTVTAEDGSTADYTVSIIFEPTPYKAITAFGFTSALNSSLSADVIGVITEDQSYIKVIVPYGTDVTALIPSFSTTGETVSVNGAVQTSASTPNDFTGDVTYTVTAEDGSSRTYTVCVLITVTFGQLTDMINNEKDVTHVDTSGITDMSDLFYNMNDSIRNNFNQDISRWDVGNVTNMSKMFCFCYKFNQDISGWDVGNVSDTASMFFCDCAFNQDISGWDVGRVTNMSSMFSNAIVFNGNISSWDVSNVTNMSSMFYSAIVFNGNISSWDVSNVTNMNSMFNNAIVFNGNISGWDVSSATNMDWMFTSAKAFNRDISGWDVSKVTTMTSMFGFAEAFNQDISVWDVSSVTSMNSMFQGAEAFDQDLTPWGSKVKDDIKHAFFSIGNCPLTKSHHPDASWADSSDAE